LKANAPEGIGVSIPRAEYRKALMQIKGALTGFINIAVTLALSLIGC
jgi:hypothetical protein